MIALNVNIEAETDAKILGKNILSISHPSFYFLGKFDCMDSNDVWSNEKMCNEVNGFLFEWLDYRGKLRENRKV